MFDLFECKGKSNILYMQIFFVQKIRKLREL